MPTSERPASRIDIIVAVFASFIGMLALAVSVYTAYWERQSVRAQVWPRLDWHFTYNDDGFSYGMENAGVGPGEIRAIEITVDGEPVANWDEALRRLLDADGGPPAEVMKSFLAGRIVRPGVVVAAVTVRDAARAAALKGAHSHGRLQVRFCYCSVLDECWTIRNNSAPEPGTCFEPVRPFAN